PVLAHGWRDLWPIPVAGLVAGACGLVFGLPATRFAGPYLALATFAIPLSFIGILKRFPHFTGGNVGKNLPQLHPEFGLDLNPSIWFYAVSWVVALAMLPASYLIVRGRFGRALRAVRDSEIASTANGVSTAAIKTAAFGISAFYCGIAGGLFAIGITYVNPDTFPIALSILLLTGIVIGGAGSLYGMVFGAVFVEFIQISWSPILLEGTYPLSGPASGYAPIPAAMKAFFSYVNAQGGVNHRQIVFKYSDDGYNPAQTVQITHQFVEQDHAFALVGGLGTEPQTAVRQYLNDNKVPQIFV